MRTIYFASDKLINRNMARHIIYNSPIRVEYIKYISNNITAVSLALTFSCKRNKYWEIMDLFSYCLTRVSWDKKKLRTRFWVSLYFSVLQRNTLLNFDRIHVNFRARQAVRRTDSNVVRVLFFLTSNVQHCTSFTRCAMCVQRSGVWNSSHLVLTKTYFLRT